MEQLHTSVVIAAIVVAVAHFAVSMMIDGEQMTIDDAIMKAGSKHGMTKMFELMQDKETAMVELDMLYKIDQYMEMRKEMTMDIEMDEQHGSRKKRKAIIPVFFRWPKSRVPYEISYEFSNSERQMIMAAIADYHRYTCIRFVPPTGSDRNRVRFQNGGGCSSYVGMIGNTQGISLAPGCRHKGIIIHEMGHALGFQHEQTRSDRDGYVTIEMQNVQQDAAYNFMKYSRNQASNYRVPYDYTSVMHYSQYAFSANGQPTINADDTKYQDAMGNRDGLSFYDIWLANEMYDCASQNGCQARECPGGFQGPDCECWCSSGVRSDPVKVCSGTGIVTKDSLASTAMSLMSCEDNHRNCPSWASAGYCQGGQKGYMMANCKYSCDYCMITRHPTPTTVTPRISNCMDLSQYCSNWASAGECSRNPSYMMTRCAKSCQVCEGMTTKATCRDAGKYCSYWTDYCTDSTYKDYLKMNCERSCGYCQASDAAPATTPKPATPVQDASCRDRNTPTYCQRNVKRCTSRSNVRNRCKKTCGMC